MGRGSNLLYNGSAILSNMSESDKFASSSSKFPGINLEQVELDSDYAFQVFEKHASAFVTLPEAKPFLDEFNTNVFRLHTGEVLQDPSSAQRKQYRMNVIYNTSKSLAPSAQQGLMAVSRYGGSQNPTSREGKVTKQALKLNSAGIDSAITAIDKMITAKRKKGYQDKIPQNPVSKPLRQEIFSTVKDIILTCAK